MMITTHNLKQRAKVEPQKLNQITTAIIPDAVPQPVPIGDGFTKMITTHDEPKAETGPVGDDQPGIPAPPEALAVPVTHKKTGRPKKAK